METKEILIVARKARFCFTPLAILIIALLAIIIHRRAQPCIQHTAIISTPDSSMQVCMATGTGAHQECDTTLFITLITGEELLLITNKTNTGDLELKVDGQLSHVRKRSDTARLAAGDLLGDVDHIIVFDGENWILWN